MDMLYFFACLNNKVLAVPATILFFGVACILTLKTKFLQIRGLPKFLSLITQGIAHKNQKGTDTINPFHALFTAMGTTIGMGNIVGPSLAIMLGGPGALFWLVCYIFLGSVTKFAEVTFAIATRIVEKDGHVIGGPMEYLRMVSPILAGWYALVMVLLFAGWSGLQSNTLAHIFAQEGIPHWITGLVLAISVFIILNGGAKRIGATASKLVPLMFVFYVLFAFMILCRDMQALYKAVLLVIHSIFSPAAAVGGFFGVTLFKSMRYGIYKGIFITESGLGTAAIPHAVADVKRSTDQGILAMGSTLAEIFLAILSGLLVLVTGIWMQGEFRSTLVYEVFKLHAPTFARFILMFSIVLFVFTTVIGNSFNGIQTFASFAGYRWGKVYVIFSLLIVFVGSLVSMPLIWEIMDTLLALVAIPHLIGLVMLSFKRSDLLRV
jgi:AGCS family alanine or glycine:cation symporter